MLLKLFIFFLIGGAYGTNQTIDLGAVMLNQVYFAPYFFLFDTK